jgi:CRISPR/Cas system CSM-associated protein Csm3 (group 7 of RAMP superfamily)
MTTGKVIYKAELKLKTALHIGCAEESPLGAMEIIKNGAGEYFLPGTSIAGVFFQSIRELFDLKYSDKNLYYKITDCKNNASILNFRSHIFKKRQTDQQLAVMIRNRVKIDRATKTAEDGSLFGYWEIEPEGITINLVIEIDNLSLKQVNTEEFTKLTEWIETVFTSWKNEGVYFGGHNSSGNGYCQLIKAAKGVITPANFLDFLDDEAKIEYHDCLLDKPAVARYKTWKILLEIEDEEDGYGTNALLIKGGASHSSLAGNPSDAVFINTGKRLYIPGSSLKGTFSMYLEKYDKSDWLKQFFGQEKSDKQGWVYFPDLIFSINDNAVNEHLINIERHAEDEFTRAVLGTAKFNEERLFYAKAEDYVRIPHSFYNGHKGVIDEMIAFIKKGCDLRLISLGANSCFPRIKLEEME